MGLSCPHCGATETLSAMQAKLCAAKRLHRPPSNPTAGTGGNVVISSGVGGASSGGCAVSIGSRTAATSNSVAVGHGSSALDFGVALGHKSHALEGQIVINAAVLEICVECGNIYSPNVREIAKELRTARNKLDLLGALAEISDHEGSPEP
jgi:hypothetical protein